MIAYLIAILIFSIPIDGTLRLLTGTPYFSLITDAIIIIAIISALRKLKVSPNRTLLFLFFICSFFTIFLFFNGSFKSTYIQLTSFRLTGLYFFAFLIPFFNRFNEKELVLIYKSLLITGLIVGTNAIRQWIFPLSIEIDFANSAGGAAKFYGDQFQGNINDFRVFSFFITSVHLVTFLSLVLYLSLTSYLTSYRKGSIEKLTIVVSTVAILLTFSRTGWLSIISGLAALVPLFIKSKNYYRNLTIITASIIALTAIIFNNELVFSRVSSLGAIDEVSSFNSRLYLWEDRIRKISNNPVGYGTGAAGWNAHEEMKLGADSNYLKFYLEMGWIGGSAFIALLVAILTTLFSTYRTNISEKSKPSIQLTIRLSATCFMIASTISMITNQILEAFPVNFIFWFITGLGSVLCRKLRF